MSSSSSAAVAPEDRELDAKQIRLKKLAHEVSESSDSAPDVEHDDDEKGSLRLQPINPTPSLSATGEPDNLHSIRVDEFSPIVPGSVSSSSSSDATRSTGTNVSIHNNNNNKTAGDESKSKAPLAAAPAKAPVAAAATAAAKPAAATKREPTAAEKQREARRRAFICKVVAALLSLLCIILGFVVMTIMGAICLQASYDTSYASNDW